MSEWPPNPVWETLSAERQRGIVVTLGRMAVRQIRGASIAEESADDERGCDAAVGRGPVRADLPAAS
jgi:hypothetical protein